MPQVAANRQSPTKDLVTRIKPRAEKFIVWDAVIPNLGLVVYPSGQKAYILRVTFKNADGQTKQRLETLGHVADFANPESVRKVALELRQRYKSGEDVRQTREADKNRDLTLRECLERYLAARATGTKPMKSSTAEDMRKGLNYGLADYVDQPITDLSPDTITAWHRQRKVVAPTRADCEARYLRAVINWVSEELPALGMPEWPTRRWSKQREWSVPNRRKNRLDRDTAPTWMQVTRTWSNERDRALFLTLYYTGWRSIEAMSLAWADVDLDHGRVILRDTKSRATYKLPLAQQAMMVLKTLPRDCEWVFPAATKTGGIDRMRHPGKAIERHRAQCGFEWAPHDLRRTFISTGEALGVGSAIVRRLTGHAIARTDAHDHYIEVPADDLAPHLQRIADALEAMAGGMTEAPT